MNRTYYSTRRKFICFISDWLGTFLLALVGLFVCSYVDNQYQDEILSASVAEEARQQVAKEASEDQQARLQLTAQAEYMTGFGAD
ncbi:hypothetical protein [Solimicrobium silvestre]|uniref:Uncharacterized protein n=1 Tax=Solimicrobium silvestre TaxID=2099400 RepID=A0A2S9GZM4_9BURK|nr:hypothetical protein [Solimicrobium silvestre]PRC93066.1 hypothetical protein S2091_2152 [Solimicrobium silvestre]